MRRGSWMSRVMELWRVSPVGLFAASFLFAFQDSATMLALPWRVMQLGGQTRAVGVVGALGLITYMGFCFLTSSTTNRIGVKRAVLISLGFTTLFLTLIPLVPKLGALFSLVACKGIVMSIFWPPVMGWVSSGSEGGSLNKRISVFNFSWAAGSIVGCYVGGTLFRVVQWLPFFTAAGATVLAIVCILGVQGRQQVPESVKESAEDDLEPMQLVLFRWIWRVGFISAWVALGALKFPIATLIKEMGRGSEYHAIISSGMNMVFMCCFFLLGRTMVWHYKFIYILMAEILLVGTLVGVGVSRTPVQLAGCVLVGTVALSFGYFSHLFYAVTGSKHRQKGAATHEIILSVGLATGSFGGGALGQWCGIRPVFFVIAGVMVGAIVVQGAILYLGRAGWLSRESKAVREGTPVRAEI